MPRAIAMPLCLGWDGGTGFTVDYMAFTEGGTYGGTGELGSQLHWDPEWENKDDMNNALRDATVALVQLRENVTIAREDVIIVGGFM